jgi:8-oxo-dGTP pyrophosphatase MutT (NUDIX family)
MGLIFPPRPSFIESLQQRLVTGPLPGHAAHQRMAHAVRRAEPIVDPAVFREAGVLITFYTPAPAEWRLIFIRRAVSHPRDKHAGQVAFPGGKRDAGDPDLMYTALREAEEEIALDLRHVDVLGALSPLYITVSKFMVHPFVAYAAEVPPLVRQAEEIEEILDLPLAAFLDPASRQSTRIRLSGGMILNHVPAYVVGGHVIWGATAMMLSELLELLPHPEA